jgi:hypothetical protein
MFFICIVRTSFTHPGGLPLDLKTPELNDTQLT